jgi:hypothetical protein
LLYYCSHRWIRKILASRKVAVPMLCEKRRRRGTNCACSFGLISRISSHPAVFFSHNKPANNTFSIINQRNKQAGYFILGRASHSQVTSHSLCIFFWNVLSVHWCLHIAMKQEQKHRRYVAGDDFLSLAHAVYYTLTREKKPLQT